MTINIATHNGTITIESPKGGHRTFRIKTQDKDSTFAPGERIVSLLIGPENEYDYHGFGFVGENGRIRVWRKKRGTEFDKFAEMLMHPQHYESLGYRYMLEGRCRVCNRKLTTPESVKSGIGPVCSGR